MPGGLGFIAIRHIRRRQYPGQHSALLARRGDLVVRAWRRDDAGDENVGELVHRCSSLCGNTQSDVMCRDAPPGVLTAVPLSETIPARLSVWTDRGAR